MLRYGVGETRGEQRGATECAVPVAEDGLHDEQRVVVWGGPAGALDRHGDMCSRDTVVAYAHL